MAYTEGDGVWRTIRGRRVFLQNSKSLYASMVRSGKFPGMKKPGGAVRKPEEYRAGVQDTQEDVREFAAQHGDVLRRDYWRERDTGIPDSAANSGQVKSPEEQKNRLATGTENGIIITDKQRGKKFGKHCSDWGLNSSVPSDRQEMEEIIRDIYKNHDEVRVGKFSGQSDDVQFFIKGHDVVIVKKSHEFVTILKNGDTDAWVKNARRQ